MFGLNYYLHGPHYYSIKPAFNSDCKLVRDGIFQTDNLIIERQGNQQVQINTNTNDKEYFDVTWLTDCEYQLNSIDGIAKVKIVSVDQNGYDCYVWQNGRTSKRIKVYRQKNAN